MSVLAAKAYIERVTNDELFREKVLMCKNKDERAALVQKEGFIFTANEIREQSKLLDNQLQERLTCSICGEDPCGDFCMAGD